MEYSLCIYYWSTSKTLIYGSIDTTNAFAFCMNLLLPPGIILLQSNVITLKPCGSTQWVNSEREDSWHGRKESRWGTAGAGDCCVKKRGDLTWRQQRRRRRLNENMSSALLTDRPVTPDKRRCVRLFLWFVQIFFVF